MLVYSELLILGGETSTSVSTSAISARRRRTTAAIPIPVISDPSGAVRRALVRLFVRVLAIVTITVCSIRWRILGYSKRAHHVCAL